MKDAQAIPVSGRKRVGSPTPFVLSFSPSKPLPLANSTTKEVLVNAGQKYHALLVGIDAYSVKPLYGCVNDIDAVQCLLLERAAIPSDDVTRLASPHPGSKHETAISHEPATLANLRAALANLASDKVQPSDRVIIYYSGHGGRAPVAGPQGTSYCESLVPVDFNEQPGQIQLLLDIEFNRFLTAIARRTRSVAVVLDCCHSAGATRELSGGPEVVARFLDFTKVSDKNLPLKLTEGPGEILDGERGFGGVDDCQVVAACLNHELAQEDLGTDGVRHGLLTRAFVTLLGQVDPGEIRSVPWSRVWQKMRDFVEKANPNQHLWMSGSYARAVLAGPSVEGDAGLPVKKTGPNDYTIDAGTLADVDEGARIAVYRDQPLFFPPLGSAEDEAARASKSLLRVVNAERARAVARCEAEPFELPPGARARLVALGPTERLRCAVVPADAVVVTAVKGSDLLQVVGEREAQARLERKPDGTWDLTDDVYGVKLAYSALLVLLPDQLDLARAILELYSCYSLPLRMATSCTDFPGQLQVRLLACPEEGMPEADAQKADLPEVDRHKVLEYALKTGTTFCVHVRNASIQRLRVTLLNCAASGRVEFLGDQVIDARSYYRFWQDNMQGAPFVASMVSGRASYIDRMVAIGTTLMDKDLKYLRSDTRFSDIISRQRSSVEVTKDFQVAESSRPVEKWTATQVILGVDNPTD
jgi:hypothetical protein